MRSEKDLFGDVSTSAGDSDDRRVANIRYFSAENDKYCWAARVCTVRQLNRHSAGSLKFQLRYCSVVYPFSIHFLGAVADIHWILTICFVAKITIITKFQKKKSFWLMCCERVQGKWRCAAGDASYMYLQL